MHTVVEETTTTRRFADSLGAYLNAKYRGNEALKQYSEFFNSDSHLDRLDAVEEIIYSFFGCLPSYTTPRFGTKKPFEAVKVEAAGFKIARTRTKDKQEKLYGPLEALGDVTYKVTNGHLIVRVFPKTKV